MTAGQKRILAAVCAGTLLTLIGITMPLVALGDVARDLDADLLGVQWVMNAYALMLAALVLISGVLADRIGRRRVFLTGLLFYSACSVGCAAASDVLLLDAFRALQGVGGALVYASSLAILAQAFKGPALAGALGAWSASIAGAFAAGPLLGGVLVQAGGWRLMFGVLAALGAPVLLAASAWLEESKDPHAPGLDWAGMVTLCVALFSLVFALSRGRDLGWGSATIVALLGGSCVSFAAFGLVESRRRHPMLDLALLRDNSFAGSAIGAFVLHASVYALLLYLTLFMLNGLGSSAVKAGLQILPFAVPAAGLSVIAGRAGRRLDPRLMISAGLFVVAVGCLLLTRVSNDASFSALLPGLLVSGTGLGLANPAVSAAALRRVAPQQSGMAAGANTTFRQVGIAAGIAILGAVYSADISSQLLQTGVASGTADAIANGRLPAVLATAPAGEARQLIDAARASSAHALATISQVALAIAAIGAAAVLALRPRRERGATVSTGPSDARDP